MTAPNARIAHMLTVPVLVDMLIPSYAQAHNCLEEEVMDDVKRGLVDARLSDALRAAIWSALQKGEPNVPETDLIDRLATAMTKRRKQAATPDRVLDKMAALFAAIDVNVGRAENTTRAMLETTQGKQVLEKSIDASGEFLASKLLPPKKAA